MTSNLVEDFKLAITFHPNFIQQSPRERLAGGKGRQIWRRERILGRGAFGTVWLEKEAAGSVRAVKEISKFSPGSIKVDHAKELAALARLSQHDRYFVRLLGWYENVHNMFFAMEFFPLGDLDGFVKTPLLERDVKVVARQLLEGLKVMHALGFAHRDLKPQNIFVVSGSPHYQVKIGDFGISKRVVQNNTALHTAIGTIGYVAPEILGCIDQERHYTNAVDVWSLGCVVYWLLTLQIPFPDQRSLILFSNKSTKFPMEALSQQGLSLTGQRFLLGLLELYPKNRSSPATSLRNPWLSNSTSSGRPQEPKFRPIDAHITGRIFNFTKNKVACSPDSKTIAFVRSGSKIIELCQIAERTSTKLPGEYTRRVSKLICLKFSPDGAVLASVQDNDIILWKVKPRTATALHTLKLNKDSTFTDIAFSPDSTRIATFSTNQMIHIWSTETGTKEHTIDHFAVSGKLKGIGYMQYICFSHDGSQIVTSSGSQIRLWSSTRTAGKPDSVLQSFTPLQIRHFAISPNGKFVAIAFNDFITVCEFATGNVLSHLKCHAHYPWSLDFSPEGRYLASGSNGSTIRIWDLETKAIHTVLKGHEGSVWNLAFSLDGEFLVSSSDDGTIRLWYLRAKGLELQWRRAKSFMPMVGYGVGGVVFLRVFYPESFQKLVGCGLVLLGLCCWYLFRGHL